MQPDDDERVPQAGSYTLLHAIEAPATDHVPGVGRANLAPSYDTPGGTTADDWAERHKHQSVLQQHLDFFDQVPLPLGSSLAHQLTHLPQDRDGIIHPLDTFRGFRRLGFGHILSLVALLIIHASFSYPTLDTYVPDPLFRIYIRAIHRCKHGSDSGAFDAEGRFVPQRFEDVFAKYAGGEGRDGLTARDLWAFHRGQRVLADPFGWFAQVFECELIPRSETGDC